MLGTLAKWLRILGYDTTYGSRNDDELIETAEAENRILLTRDKCLFQKAKKKLPVVYLESTSLTEQLTLTIKKTGMSLDKNKMLTRCTICNTRVIQKEKNKVQDKVPSHAFRLHEQFWECPNCRRIYWMGSHWLKMQERIEKII
jgi:uncharacterized protein with PIN domain